MPPADATRPLDQLDQLDQIWSNGLFSLFGLISLFGLDSLGIETHSGRGVDEQGERRHGARTQNLRLAKWGSGFFLLCDWQIGVGMAL